MKSTTNHPRESSSQPDAGPDKPSRAAEYIAALYVVLVLLTPGSCAMRRSSRRRRVCEIQMSYKARARAET